MAASIRLLYTSKPVDFAVKRIIIVGGTKKWLRKSKEEGEKALKELEIVPQYIKAYAQYVDDSEKTDYWEMTVDYGRRSMQMQIDWAQSCIEQLEKKD